MTAATTTISTHVLDTALGAPAGGIAVTLRRVDAAGDVEVGGGTTNADGRVASFVTDASTLEAGRYRLCFDVAPYFAGTARTSFYTEICIDFLVGEKPQHYHVPLLLSPFGYSTYRGS
jgi:5-hydroxyisourate hydrolase